MQSTAFKHAHVPAAASHAAPRARPRAAAPGPRDRIRRCAAADALPPATTSGRHEGSSPISQLLRLKQAENLQRLNDHHHQQQQPGRVFLVGTGPGDPGLLTLRAVQLMQRADVVLYDRLVSDDILRLIGPSALMVYVGKAAGYHSASQQEIHELLLAFAQQGACVVRLKGGDPFVFGRGGEEVSYLQERGVEVHTVPGITAASGICAELGIPLTHRGLATSARFLTGHAREGGEDALLDDTLAAAADPHTTLVVYMGLGTLPSLVGALGAAGYDLGTPAVAVERGTTSAQRAAWARVGELGGAVAGAGLASPTLLVIGAVVGLAPGWAAAQQQQQQQQQQQGGRRRQGGSCARELLPDAVEAVLGLPLGGVGGSSRGERRGELLEGAAGAVPR